MAASLLTSISEWLLTYAIHSSMLLLVITLLAHRSSSEQSLERLWRIGLFGPVLTTSLQEIVPGWFATLVLPGGSSVAGFGAREILLASATNGLSSSTIVVIWVAVTAWAVTALGGIGWLLLGHFRLSRMLRGRTPLSVASHPSITNIRVAPHLSTPIALVSGELCLPAAALNDLSGDELNAVIAHEQEHIRRRDPFWLLISSVVCRLLFFQPLNWIAATRLRALAEFQCDATAVRKTSPVAVAGALVAVSHWIGRKPLAVPGMVSRESLTVRRVRRILEGRLATESLGRVVAFAALFLLSLAALGPGVALQSGAGSRYTIAAYDDGGPFNVTIERGRVVEVTMNGSTVPSTEIRQQGTFVRITPSGAPALELTLTAEGGMRWNSRPPVLSLD